MFICTPGQTIGVTVATTTGMYRRWEVSLRASSVYGDNILRTRGFTSAPLSSGAVMTAWWSKLPISQITVRAGARARAIAHSAVCRCQCRCWLIYQYRRSRCCLACWLPDWHRLSIKLHKHRPLPQQLAGLSPHRVSTPLSCIYPGDEVLIVLCFIVMLTELSTV